MIQGELVRLEPLEAEDLVELARWRNWSHDWFFGPRYLPESGQARWYERYLAQTADLMFTVKNEVATVGFIGLADIDLEHRRAEVGRLLIDSIWQNRGYGTDATRALCRYAFRELGLHRLYLYVFVSNTAAIKLYELAGFKSEAVLFDHVWKDGAFRNVVLMARLEADE